MKAKAPEKLFITNDEKRFSDKCHSASTEKYVDDDIEYIRADAFIEKAAEWIKNKAENYIVNTPLCSYFDYKRAVEDFKKAQKGEKV